MVLDLSKQDLILKSRAVSLKLESVRFELEASDPVSTDLEVKRLSSLKMKLEESKKLHGETERDTLVRKKSMLNRKLLIVRGTLDINKRGMNRVIAQIQAQTDELVSYF